MKKVLIATAGALALAAGSASGGGDKTQSSPQSSNGSGGDKTQSSPQSSNSSGGDKTQNSPQSSNSSQVSGDVKATDAPAMAIVIVLPSGDEQNLSLSNDASITRDGKVASLDQVKEGDNVRASFDPDTHKATSLEVKSKGGTKATDDSKAKDDSKTMDDSKKPQK
jgi:Cu/Ag efflux protein CusF